MSAAAQERGLAEGPIRVRFGNFEADFRSRELRKHGLKVKVQQLPFEVLRILLENPGAVVSRQELQQRLWPDDVVVDFDHGLNTAVRKLRDVLSDSAATPRYIATVDRQGYRFVAPVMQLETATEPEVVPFEAAPAPLNPPRRPRGIVWASVGALLVLAVVALYVGWRGLHPQPAAAGHRVILAVLPFANLTGDANQDYFIDGLTAEMIIQAGRLDPSHLGVISRASVMQYKKSQEQLERIAGEMGVDYVLEGTVRRDGSHVRVTAELIQVNDRTSLWAREYDRELNSTLALQREVAQAIAGEIQATLSGRNPNEAGRNVAVAPQSDAHELYLKGRYFWNKRTPDGFEHAADYFQQAIAKDPNYARAYSGLADTYLLMVSFNLKPPREFIPKARAAALRALEIDPNLAEAHTSMALLKENADWDWQAADKEYRQAIALDPNYATAHQWYAEYLTYQGRFDEALAESNRARQLDPLSLIIATDHGAVLLAAGQYDRAMEQLRTVLEMEPDFPRAQYLMIECYVEKGMFKEALAALERGRPVQPEWDTIMLRAYVSGRMGNRQEAIRGLRKLQAMRQLEDWNSSAIMVGIYAAVHDTDDAMASLEKAFAARSNNLVALRAERIYGPLRSDPRFQDLMRRVGLPQ
jgi:TolB-like protein/DNA-binding winged helix-turn-helix (wHTH) protein/Tfp pilus assembly protein PilF